MRLQTLRALLTSASIFSIAHATSEHLKAHNANHLFNAVHSSMRQWGSSLNHNGMSFFLATVPAGTQLYHGTSNPEPIEGMQWLAFEPEHALIFARPNRGPLPGDGNGPPKNGGEQMEEYGRKLHHRPDMPHDGSGYGPPPDAGNGIIPPHHPHEPSHQPHGPPPPHHGKPPPPPHHGGPPPPHPGHGSEPPNHQHGPPSDEHFSPPSHYERRGDFQQPFGQQKADQDTTYGFLHTYEPEHPLRLLYIDGLSAGKTPNGTLDTQDMLLLNLTEKHGPMGGEYKRAEGLCNLTSTLWEGKIDGILRMEGGFEIILCNFEKHLQRTDVIAVPTEERRGGPGGGLGGWKYIKALTSRYNGIGGERVVLDFEGFVSVFAYPEIEGVFLNDVQSDYAMPRLQNVKDADRLRVKDDVTAMILRKDWTEERESRNWQAVADMVVQRYSKALHYLHTDEDIREDKIALATYLMALLRPFIDTTARNATLETQRCVSQLIPALPTPPRVAASLAHGTLHTVTYQICDTLLTSLSIACSPTSHSSFTSVYASHAVELIDYLIEYLRWTTWKNCGTCADEEVCFIPIWPSGSHEDHAHPQCRNEEAVRDRNGYWGSRMGPPRGKGRKGEEKI